MAGVRQALSLALLALLLVLVAGPVAAAQCRMRGSCPMMKAAPRAAACPGTQGADGMSAPMDCCQPVATPAPSSALPGLETPLAALSPALPGGGIAPEPREAEERRLDGVLCLRADPEQTSACEVRRETDQILRVRAVPV